MQSDSKTAMSQKLELFAVLRTWSALATGVAEIQRADVIFGKVSVVSLDVLGSTESTEQFMVGSAHGLGRAAWWLHRQAQSWDAPAPLTGPSRNVASAHMSPRAGQVPREIEGHQILPWLEWSGLDCYRFK